VGNLITARLVKADELNENECMIWREMCAQTLLFKSPVLGPEFFQAVSQVREDAYVAIYEKGNEIIGFLGHHRRPNGFARPIGAPFSDYSALITPPNPQLNMQEALGLAGITKFQTIGFVDPYATCNQAGGIEDEAFGLDLTINDGENNAGKKQRKNVNRLRRHLAEDFGDCRFVFDDRCPSNFKKAIELKRAQTKLTGIHDFLSPVWVEKLMINLFNADRSGLHGCLMTLYAGEAALAFHFGLRLGQRMHPWVATFDPDYFKYSPGQIFLMDCKQPLMDNGIEYYDLSTGAKHYKDTFTNTSFPVRHVLIKADDGGAKSKIANAENLFTRIQRRLDQIACLELDFAGRAKGIFNAATHISRRVAL
jgi:CelD/BcsL family acetyltransferase involved in cellulose biosynthesis